MPTTTSPFTIALLLISWAFRTHAFETNCTFPAPDTSEFYVSAPNIRSTLGIIWSSLGTIAACTYGVLHLNVPQQRSGRRPGGFKILKWYWHSLRPSLDWTGLTIMFPELYTAIAYGDLYRARITAKELTKSVQSTRWKPDGGCSLTHGFFANMGGFAIRCTETSMENPSTGNPSTNNPSTEDPSANNPSTGNPSTNNPSTENSSSENPSTENSSAPPIQRPPIHLSGDSLLALLNGEHRELIKAPLLSQADIEDRSKSNLFAKSVVVLQVLYYCGSCLLRLIHHLPVTQLEIGTFGFAVCSVISFYILFPKPRSVNTTTVIAEFNGSIPDDIAIIHYDECRKKSTIANNSRIHPDYADCTVPVLAALLGAVHVAGAMFSHFPSPVDMWLWRTSAVVSAVSLPILWVSAAIFLEDEKRPIIPLPRRSNTGLNKQRQDNGGHLEEGDTRSLRATPSLSAKLFLALCVVLYCISRIVLMVEMVRGLFYMTSDAFKATWAASLPHIG
jgi:hypothetical protein